MLSRNGPLRSVNGSIWPDLGATMRLALPLIASQVAGFGTNIVEVVLAGHLGPEVLGAVAVGNNVWMIPLMAVVGTMMAMPPSIAQLDGAGRRQEIAAMFRQGLFLAIGLGLGAGALVFAVSGLIGPIFGIDPALHSDIAGFLRAVACGGPALGISVACNGLANGASRPRVTMIANFAAVLLLIPVAWALMYGRLGLPAWGAFGSGLANTIVLWTQALCMLGFVRFSPRFADLGWDRGRVAPDWRVIGGLLRVGVPMSISVLLEVGMFSTVGVMIGGLGALAVASHQIVLNVAALSFMVPLGLSVAITVRVGNAVGRRDSAGVRRAGLIGLWLALLLQAISSGLMLAFPTSIIGVYTDDAAVIQGALALLVIAAIFQISDGIQVAASGALRGLKDTLVPMLVTAFAYWGAGVPIGWYLAFKMGLGAQGMWMGMVAGLSVAAVLLTARFVIRTRKVG